MKTNFNSTDITLLMTRLILALVTAAHGAQKLFGWFGGYGFDGTMAFFTDTIGLPWIFGLLIILTETLGMVALALGLFGRFFSAAAVVIMLGAINFHSANGFFMNWNGLPHGEGFEFHVLAIGLALPGLILGSGAYSIDKAIASRTRNIKTSPVADVV
jgi:putative oxidoreductase